MKYLLAVIALLFVAVLGGALALSGGALKLSMEELEAKYTTPESRFMDIDGIRTHYMDQGSGPVVVLLHASLMNLRTWDSMAEALQSQFRVIRMDRLLSGLTGADPSQAYSVEREMELLEGLVDQLDIDTFALVATSSGGTVAFRYAAQNPQRVSSLLLINSAGLPRTAATNPNRARGSRIARWVQRYHRSMSYWRKELALNFVAPNEPPDWLVEMVYDMSRREALADQAAIYMGNYSTGDPEAVLAEITVPTKILWGIQNATVVHLEADVFEHWLVNAPATKKKYPAVGHYMYLEIPDVIEADVLDFLTGVSRQADAVAKTTVGQMIRGKTVCRDTNNDNAACGVERWTMYLNRNGSRYLHIVSDDIRAGLSKHAVVWIDSNNKVREAYVNIAKPDDFVGSTYVVLRDGKAYVAADDSQFPGGGVKLKALDEIGPDSSIGTGPAAGDIAHLLNHDLEDSGPQTRSVYWVGGRFGSMVGIFINAENTFLGRDDMTLADGTAVSAAHYRLVSGTELWMLEPYDVLLRAKLEFGDTKGLVFETTEIEITEQSF